MLDRTMTFVLAGGAGSRLYPLTAHGAKPAVPFGGRYRIIDFVINSLIAAGSIISGGSVWNSILSRDIRVDEDAVVEESILFDGVSVGPGTVLRRCIVEKGVHVPAGERIGFDMAADASRFTVSDDGVVVVPQDFVFTESKVQQSIAVTTAPRSDHRNLEVAATKVGAAP